jgi:NAD(P)-dependent dehydrogenase (short-subunit alcohol dehydrogenase family)
MPAMDLVRGHVAVVTGAGSGIGLAMAERFARSGLNIVAADVQRDALAAAGERIAGHGVEVLTVPCDVSKPDAVAALADATLDRFGGVHLLCNNAGVAPRSDPWFGPLSAWEWVIGVNFWGVVHGCRAFLPHLLGGGHIVNTASIAGLYPGFSPAYDASKHAVVAISEGLYNMAAMIGLPIGVSVLCPGWVKTAIVDADRNWPDELGDRPAPGPTSAVVEPHVRRAIDEGATPAFIADAIADAVTTGRFWVIPQQEFLDLVVRRWDSVAARENPSNVARTPGLPDPEQLRGDILAALGLTAPGGP